MTNKMLYNDWQVTGTGIKVEILKWYSFQGHYTRIWEGYMLKNALRLRATKVEIKGMNCLHDLLLIQALDRYKLYLFC